ncbi:type IV secretory system conjugative DNA transfer family protein [Planococcus sp. ANT_H30]|uniref:VirD4-like conjugal transfer protein, CD1115 family n=1 Tax=Planococcus sp. ANT_H30 TaxID=2597347 RepID=UPI0011EDC8E0|nr:type IV secretory system conjugative DNA transfer family protein [Planococcus sp. ANT_H30]KAA0956113.1 type IV secretory system conjugative DNA transfer family protein [Planococcus sp. ANT_H30]
MFNESFIYYLKKIGIPLLLLAMSFSVFFLTLNALLNAIVEVFQKTFNTGSLLELEPINLTTEMFYTFPFLETASLVYAVLFLLAFVPAVVLTFKYITNFGQIKKEQKGSARFTTFKEIQQQYRDVPEKGEKFKGSGGVPVARHKKRIFIDDSPVNNMVIGTTRSGKGETFVFSAIDIYSRAEKQASMILNDPKGELYAASKDTLEGLGYHVEVLNLMNPIQSMSYNLLQLTIDAFMEGNYSLSQQYARSVAFMLYHDPKAKDPFWANSATDLCTALILALCEQCKLEREKINMYNVALMLSDLGTRTVMNEDEEEVSALDDFFSKFPENHPAKMQYATINFSSGQTRASILANANAKLGVFTLDGTAKLTSRNSFDMSKIGFSRWIKGKTAPDTRIHVTFSSNETATIRTDADGMFTLFHKHPLQVGDSFTIRAGKEETVVSVTGLIERERKDGVMIHEGLLEHEVMSGNVEIQAIMEFDKPTAVFMIVPDYDATLNVIGSLYVKQVYTNLAHIASNSEGGKCHREVIFILDEFGNMPAIEGMANIVTVCLGRNIRFNLVIQAYAQLENLYGDDWKTIDGNCGNTLYLLTADESTAELISKKLGDETILTKSRSGQTLSMSKSKTESVDSRRLMTATEVMGLKEGEMIVIRIIKRQDKDRKRIKSYPIFLTGKTALKYRWEYLSAYYNTDNSINDIDIPCEHSMTDLNQLRASFTTNNFADNLIKQLPEKEGAEKSAAVASVKQKKAAARHEKRRAEMQKEIDFNQFVNDHYKVQQLFNSTFLKNVDAENPEKYMEMGIVDFREFILANDHQIEDKFCSVILTKINGTLTKIKEEEERVTG